MKYGFNKKDGKFSGVYTDEFQTPDEIETIPKPPNESLIHPIINESKTDWIEGLTGDKLQSEKKEREKNYIKLKYEVHRKNGWGEYQDFRAGVVLDIADGLINETQAFQIENYLKNCYDKINNTGDWKTARFVLSQLTGHPEWMQKYIDEAIQRVDNYILNNYDS